MSEAYRDSEVLQELYHEKELSMREVAEHLNTSRLTISRWMNRYSIPRRDKSEAVELSKKDESKSYRDKDVLENLYFDEGLSQPEIADKFNTGADVISYWMDKHNLEVDPSTNKNHIDAISVNRATFHTNKRGYEHSSSKNDMVFIHRLVAVAEYGFDAVKNKHVHHKNHISWDNRADNLMLLLDSEHAKLHNKGDGHKLTKSDAIGILKDYALTDKTQYELADEYGVSQSTVCAIVNDNAWEHI